MSDSIIEVENLGKRYRIRHHQGSARYVALRDVIAARFMAPMRGLKSRAGNQVTAERRPMAADPASEEDFWALKDVSFTIERGEVVGIIGRNGAGKSTLLKVLSRITEPTEGRVTLRGRVASLLEVGTGFHPELTGRENIFLNGAILGMTRAEIARRFDQIVEFAEVEKFLDTPVKRYSSGMYVRLAFAVAAHMEPEILIVDEVLAVGDAQFQKKCLGKMEEVSKGGRTVLFVSHNMTAISTLTQRALLIQAGRVVADAGTQAVIGEYLRGMDRSMLLHEAEPWPDKPRVTRVEVITSEPNNVHVWSKPFEVRFQVTTPRAIRGLCLSFQVLNSLLQPVLHLWTFDSEQAVGRSPGVFELVCRIPKLRLYMGNYSLKFYLSEPPGGEMFEIVDGICPFEVVMHGRYREFQWQEGSCNYIEDCDWHVGRAA
jgi:lipopolysaccharide transport system ATP-binding protein